MSNLIPTVNHWLTVVKSLKFFQSAKDFIARFLNLVVRLIKWWQESHLNELWAVLRYARMSVFVLLFGAAFLILDQGRELAMRLDQDWRHFLFFYVGLFFWALQNWFGSRRMLEERFGRPSPTDHGVRARAIRHVPRIMGLGAYLFASVAIFLAWQRKGLPLFSAHTLLLLITLASGVLFYYLFAKRHAWIKQRKGENYDDLKAIERYLRPITYAYSGLFLFGGFLFPAHLGFWTGSLAILFFGLSSIVPAGNWAIRYAEHRLDQDFADPKAFQSKAEVSGVPVISAMLVLALILSFFNDNHAVRTLDQADIRNDLKTALEEWDKHYQAEGPKPLVIVATAGGGIRASYWTATVLGGLTDAEPNFGNALFAISGVSGGSVGSAFYQAALREGKPDCSTLNDRHRKLQRGATCYEGLLQQALSRDFLAPNLSNLLYADLIQRFLPPLGFPDRQQALEKGWEQAFEETFPKAEAGGLSAAMTAKQWQPILMLNATHMETGKRVVASGIKLDERFTDAVDLLELIGADLRLSTAAGNSARFTYVSPVGTLPCDAKQSWLCRNGHLVDGGYFENFGAVTARQTLQALQDMQGLAKKIKPIVIVISSDPLLACSEQRKKDDDGKCDTIDDDKTMAKLPHESGANESLGPVKALLNTRGARGILAAKELRHWAENWAKKWAKICEKSPDQCGFADAPKFYHFRMEVPNDKADPALGWLLSVESEQTIEQMLCKSTENRKALQEVLGALARPSVPPKSIEAVCAADS